MSLFMALISSSVPNPVKIISHSSFAKTLAVDNPIPLVEPVTTATLFKLLDAIIIQFPSRRTQQSYAGSVENRNMCCYWLLFFFVKSLLFIVTIYILTIPPLRVVGGFGGSGQETWNVRRRWWWPSFFMTSFNRDMAVVYPGAKAWPPPRPVENSRKKDGRQTRQLIFHVSGSATAWKSWPPCPPPPPWNRSCLLPVPLLHPLLSQKIRYISNVSSLRSLNLLPCSFFVFFNGDTWWELIEF